MSLEAEDLLRRTRKLKREIRAYGRGARELLRSRPETPEDEPVDPEAELLGTLACLLVDDLDPALKKLDELDHLLRRFSFPRS